MNSKSPSWVFCVYRHKSITDTGDHDFNQIREASESEVQSVRAAVAELYDYQNRDMYKLAVHNFDEFKHAESSVIEVIESQPQRKWPHPPEILESFRILFLNWLFSFRLYLEHIDIQTKRRYGEQSEEYRSFTAATSKEYDSKFGYRFLYRLRNYAQHYGPPPLTGRISVDVDEDPPRWLELYFERSPLLGFEGWSKVKEELESLPDEEIHLEDLMEQVMEALATIDAHVATIDAPLMRQYLDVLRPYWAAVPGGEQAPAGAEEIPRPCFVRLNKPGSVDEGFQVQHILIRP